MHASSSRLLLLNTLVDDNRDQIFAMAILSDHSLVSVSIEGEMRQWNVTDISHIRAFKDLNLGKISAIASLSETHIVLGASMDSIILLNLMTNQLVHKFFNAHEATVSVLARLSADDFVSGSEDGAVKCWSVKDKKCTATFSDHSLPVLALSALPDKRIASGSEDHFIKIWNVRDYRDEPIVTLSNHAGPVLALALLSNGCLVSGSTDTTIKLWDITSYACLRTLFGHASDIFALANLPEGVFISGSSDGMLKVWDPNHDYRCIVDVVGHDDAVTALGLWSGGRLTSASYDGTIKIWEICLSAFVDSPSDTPPSTSPPPKQETKTDDDQNAGENRASPHSEDFSFFGLHVDFQRIPKEQIDYERTLGEGSFGIVWQANWGRHSVVAVKKLKAIALSADALQSFFEEARLHARLCHQFIVPLYGICPEPGHYAMVMQYMSFGSLYDVLHTLSIVLTWPLRLTLAAQMSSGLAYLHAQDILHRDLKSPNVLLDEHMTAKLSDFGLSEQVKRETVNIPILENPVRGSIRWMAPELFERSAKHSTASDVYALGVIFSELSRRKAPFEGELNANDVNVRAWVKEGQRPDLSAETPAHFAEIVRACWAQDAEARPTSDVVSANLSSGLFSETSAAPSSTTNEPPSSGYREWSSQYRWS